MGRIEQKIGHVSKESWDLAHLRIYGAIFQKCQKDPTGFAQLSKKG
jgi:hypothetical protein